MGSAASVAIAAAACSGVVSGHTAAALNTEPFSVTAGDVVHPNLPPCAPLTRSGLRPAVTFPPFKRVASLHPGAGTAAPSLLSPAETSGIWESIREARAAARASSRPHARDH